MQDSESTRSGNRLIAWWYLFNAMLLMLLVLVPVWIKAALHQYHNYDLGIFAQALHSIGPGNLNPFLPALNLPLFNDHFDPILILVAPLGHVLEPAYAALLIEHLFVLLSPLPLVLLLRGQRARVPWVCFAVTYLLFNRGLLSAVSFPVHPTTWASFFLVLAGVLALTKRTTWLVLVSLLLMACKEEFPFVVLVMGVYCLCRRDFKRGASLVGLAVCWILVAFVVRPHLLVGDTHDYASRVLSPLLTAPFATLWGRLRAIGDCKRLFQSVVPLLPVAYWFIRRRISPNWMMLAAALPLLAIRFIDGAWQFHYLAPIPPLLLLVTLRPGRIAIPVRYAVLGIAATLLSTAGPVRKSVATYGRVAELRGGRVESIERARAHLLQHQGGVALVEGNLSPLLAGRKGVFQIGGVQPARAYRFFLAERPPCGDPWPATFERIEALIEEWRHHPGTVVRMDNKHVFFAEDRTYRQGAGP